MENVFLAGAVAGLIVSWLYILFLRVKIRECVAYIQARIDLANPGLRNGGNSRGVGDKSMGASRFPLQDPNNDVSTPNEGETMATKPKLIVANSGLQQPFHYLCSHCFWPFSLAGDQPPKAAVAELFHSFREHIEQEHPIPGQELGAGFEGR